MVSGNIDIKLNAGALKDIEKSLLQQFSVRVGILGSTNQREEGEQTNAEIGLLHEYGSITKNIPARSFLRMPLQEKQKELQKYMTSRDWENILINDEIKKELELLGIYAEEIIDDAFDTKGFGKWKPNSARTIAEKGGDKPLIDTQELRKSITSEVVKND